MAGKITTNSVVLGDSVTDTQNFVLKTNADGTATLARGALGGLGTVFGVNGSGALTGATLVSPTITGATITVAATAAPAFSAYLGSHQYVTAATYTIVQIATKEYDTATCFNNTGSTVTLNGLSVPAYSFCPNVAGYYQINGMISNDGSSTACTNLYTMIYKNGVAYKASYNYVLGFFAFGVSSLVYLNGTGDYVGLYGYQGTVSSSNPRFNGGTSVTWFNGSMVRSA